MPVYRFSANSDRIEDSREWGIVVANDRDEAKAKIERDGFSYVSVKKIRGISALWRGFTALLRGEFRHG